MGGSIQVHLGKGTGHGVFPDMQAGMLFGTGNNLLDGTWPDWPARGLNPPRGTGLMLAFGLQRSISNTEEVVECI